MLVVVAGAATVIAGEPPTAVYGAATVVRLVGCCSWQLVAVKPPTVTNGVAAVMGGGADSGSLRG